MRCENAAGRHLQLTEPYCAQPVIIGFSIGPGYIRDFVFSLKPKPKQIIFYPGTALPPSTDGAPLASGYKSRLGRHPRATFNERPNYFEIKRLRDKRDFETLLTFPPCNVRKKNWRCFEAINSRDCWLTRNAVNTLSWVKANSFFQKRSRAETFKNLAPRWRSQTRRHHDKSNNVISTKLKNRA